MTDNMNKAQMYGTANEKWQKLATFHKVW